MPTTVEKKKDFRGGEEMKDTFWKLVQQTTEQSVNQQK